MKYCSRCVAELVDEAVVCTKCGCAVGATRQIVTGVSGISQKFIAGIVTLVLGVVGLVCSLVKISSDKEWKYSYTSPYSDHEIMMIAILVISIIATIVGAVMLISGKIKKWYLQKQFKMSRSFKFKLIRAIVILLICLAFVFFKRLGWLPQWLN
jgi:uncharacterized membrane protein